MDRPVKEGTGKWEQAEEELRAPGEKQGVGFNHAFRGIFFCLLTEKNARTHLLATGAVIALGFVTQREAWQWCMLVVAIGLVWLAELFNTAIEQLANRVTRHPDPFVMRAKDCAAGAVLMASAMALVIGVIVLWPWH